MIHLLSGDNAAVLPTLAPGSVTLAYLDPPFATGRDFRTKAGELAYSDRWPTFEAYLDHLRVRLELLRPLLAPHGSVVVHVDPRTSGYVRVLGDGIFGRESFASEIVWRYRRWPSPTTNFQRVHDVLLRWVADPHAAPHWTQLHEPLAASTLATWGTGRQQAQTDATGRRTRSRAMQEDSPGVPLGDVWELPIIAPSSHERTGYPTQKPEALLERLQRALTVEGDLVVDPYCGSGTTLAVAARLGRSGIGIDASPVAIATARERLAQFLEAA
jgi:adenine specific DNA methylase Mod